MFNHIYRVCYLKQMIKSIYKPPGEDKFNLSITSNISSTGSKFFQTSLDDLLIADYQREELSHSAQDFFSTPTLLSLFVPFLQIAPFCIQAAPSMFSPVDQPDIWTNMTMQAMLTFEYRQIAPVATQLQTRHNAMLQ